MNSDWDWTFTEIAIVAAVVLFMALAAHGCMLMLREQDACNARGGVYVRQAIGYGCLEPQR